MHRKFTACIFNHLTRLYKQNFFTEKNGFVTATKLGTTNEFFVASTKNFAAATKRCVDRTKYFVVVTKYFGYPYFTNDFVGITKPFFRVLYFSPVRLY